MPVFLQSFRLEVQHNSMRIIPSGVMLFTTHLTMYRVHREGGPNKGYP